MGCPLPLPMAGEGWGEGWQGGADELCKGFLLGEG